MGVEAGKMPQTLAKQGIDDPIGPRGQGPWEASISLGERRRDPENQPNPA
jgi:hypothetical protein